jgi:hypothetical protein
MKSVKLFLRKRLVIIYNVYVYIFTGYSRSQYAEDAFVKSCHLYEFCELGLQYSAPVNPCINLYLCLCLYIIGIGTYINDKRGIGGRAEECKINAPPLPTATTPAPTALLCRVIRRRPHKHRNQATTTTTTTTTTNSLLRWLSLTERKRMQVEGWACRQKGRPAKGEGGSC